MEKAPNQKNIFLSIPEYWKAYFCLILKCIFNHLFLKVTYQKLQSFPWKLHQFYLLYILGNNVDATTILIFPEYMFWESAKYFLNLKNIWIQFWEMCWQKHLISLNRYHPLSLGRWTVYYDLQILVKSKVLYFNLSELFSK